MRFRTYMYIVKAHNMSPHVVVPIRCIDCGKILWPWSHTVPEKRCLGPCWYVHRHETHIMEALL